MTFGRITAVLGVIFAITVALILAFPDMRWILPIAAAEQAEGIDDLFRLMLIVGSGIFIFVQGLLLYFVWLYRRRPDEDDDETGRALHGDNRLEIAWTVAPALFLVVLTILSFRELEELHLNEVIPDAATEVEVYGFQFAWEFIYPETGISEVNTLTLQKGVPTTLAITSRDVNHAFWVPEFRIKQDATDGYVRRIHITPTMTHEEAGYPEGFPLRCAELCGPGHSVMQARVLVLEEADYLAWQEAALAQAASQELDAVTIYQNRGCIGCHQLDAAGANGQVGPSHNNMGVIAAERIAAPDYTGSATTPAEYIAESIRQPEVYVVPGYPPNLMPPYPPEEISDDELNAIVELLLAQQ